jgi:hypothetical protein
MADTMSTDELRDKSKDISGTDWEWCDCAWPGNAAVGCGVVKCGCPDTECRARLYRDSVIHWEGKHWKIACAFKETLGRLPAGPIARLFTAAPELLAACEAWVAYMDKLDADSEPGDQLTLLRRHFHAERVEMARDAIRKAKGDL